jgi:hypothetical protein
MGRKLKKGIYRHYKGKLYHVIGVASHSETLEKVVVYKALYKTKFGRGALWVRPLAMFTDMLVVDGKRTRRFRKVVG